MSLTILSVAYPFAPVAPDTAGGAEQVLLALDRASCRAGHRSLVVACRGSKVDGTLIEVPRPAGELDDAAIRRGREQHAQAIRDALQRYPVDLVHMHGLDFHAYLPPPGVPVLATLHLPLAWYTAEALSPSRPDTWLHCVSADQQERAPEHTWLLPPIENGVDPAAFDAGFARRGFALMLSRICPEKGIHLAIEAARQAGVPLLVSGELYPYAAHRRYFETEVRPRLDRLRRCIHPVGPAAKRRLLASARCVLIPSLAEETSSLVAMEAAAAGTPVIAFARGALGRIVREGLTGFLVEDVASMSRAIGRTDEIDPAACQRVAREHFSAGFMVDAYFRRYAALATRRTSAA